MGARTFTWDPAKAAANEAKHRVSFHEAREVFYDPLAIGMYDEVHSTTEDRWILVGSSSRQRVLMVAFIELGDMIRIISARKATARERYGYETQQL